MAFNAVQEMNAPQKKNIYARGGKCIYESKQQWAIADTLHADTASPFTSPYAYGDSRKSEVEGILVLQAGAVLVNVYQST